MIDNRGSVIILRVILSSRDIPLYLRWVGMAMIIDEIGRR